jgi:hypothetical protein
MFFAEKFAVLIALNRRAAAGRRGVGYTFRQEEAVSLQD